MKRIMVLLLLIALPLMAASDLVLPWAPDLTPHADTLVVTVAEQGVALGVTSGAFIVKVINPNNYWLRYRWDTSASPVTSYIGTYSAPLLTPFFILAQPQDSLFITGEDTCIIFIEWYSVD